MIDYSGRVAAGVALLDQLSPGWRDKVNVSQFDIRDSRKCVLGQIYGTFSVARWDLNVDGHELVACGFDFLASDMGDYDALQDAWLEVL